MTTHTTNHLSISPRDRVLLWWHWHGRTVLTIITTTLIGLALGAALYRAIRPAAHPQTLPTPALAPIIIIATPRAEVLPTPAAVAQAVLPHTLTRAVVAYDSPNGGAIGAIEAGRGYQLLARYGADWLQADVQGSGVVWLRSAEVLDMPADLADMQPAPQPQVVYVAAQPVAMPTPTEQGYTVTSVPPAEPAWVPSGPIRKEDFTAPDPNAACAFVGCLRGTP